MSKWFYSVRMRATRSGQHVGGAERLVPGDEWLRTAAQLSLRARAYSAVDRVSMVSELVPGESLQYTATLPVATMPAVSTGEARRQAALLLEMAGVSKLAVEAAFNALDTGPAPGGGVMRGGMLLDAITAERLEPDRSRGIRVTRMDYVPACWRQLEEWLLARGLTSHRISEALAVASKASWSGALAELCWSDDRDYVAGYVASRVFGYCRFRQIKNYGTPFGGRAFFLASQGGLTCKETVSRFMELTQRCPLLFNGMAQPSTALPPVMAQLGQGTLV